MTQQTLPVRRISWIVSACAASALLVAGCGKSPSTDTASPAQSGAGTSTGAIAAQQKVDAVAALVPADIRAKGSVQVGSDASYPPMESIAGDGKTVVGLDPDLGKALGEVMGIKFEYVNSSFDAIIPGLQAKKFDLGMSGFNDTEARRKTLDFVDYYKGGSALFSTGKSVAGVEDLCGTKVAVQKGTVQQDDVTAQSDKCKQAGKPVVDLQVYPDQTAANLALASGRAEISLADTPIAAYQVQQSGGKFKIVGAEYGVVMHGIAVLKDGPMVKPLVAALRVLMENGAYQKILDKWNLGQTKLSEPLLNSAPAPK
jgi:polar amino acid transport system substrate-binding protein